MTVTEVGKYKKEIAFHGDAINTAARIQAKCNELDQQFLISEELKAQLDTNNSRFQQMEAVELRGKRESVLVYSVHAPEM